MYTEAHEKIREDPDGEKAEKKDRNAVEWRCHSSHFLCNSSPRQFAVRQDITYDKDGDTMKASASSSFDIWCLCKCLPCHRHQMALSIPASTKSLWSSDAKRFTPHNSSEC